MTQPTSNTQNISPLVDKLLLAIYQGPLEETPWLGFLNLLCKAVESDYATLMLRPPKEGDAGAVLNAVVASDNVYNDYNNHYFSLDPFVDLPPGKAFCLRELVSEEDLAQSPFFEHYMKPVGVHYIMGADMYGTDGMNARLRVTRQESSPAFGSKEKRLIELLLPHIEQAIILHRHLCQAKTERTLFAGAVEQLQIGAIVLNEKQQVIQSNKVADDLIESSSLLNLKNNTLQIGSIGQNEQFKKTIAEVFAAHQRSEPGFVRAFRLEKNSSLGSLGLLIRPVPKLESSESYDNPSVVIFISDPEQNRPVSSKILGQLFAFTPAESELALLLAHGLTIDEACTELQVSRNTAKSHLSAMFSKTGVSRQTQLVRLVLKSVVSFGA